jgi:Domain of unknown function (DUF4340)
MIKKTTLLVLLCAVALGGAVYYFDWRNAKVQKPSTDTTKPAFSFQASDVTSLALTHPGQPAIRFEKHDGIWKIVEPIETGADESSVDGIVDSVAGAEVMQSEPGTADRRQAYGLDIPKATLELQLRNGAKHTLLIGNKSFTGDSIYTIVDGGTSVSLLPELVSTAAGKSFDDLRDKTVLHIDPAQVASFDVKGASAEIAATKDGDAWKLTKPTDSHASQESIDSLLQAVSAAKMTSVASESAENLARYGLATPAITFTSIDSKGAQSTLLVGKSNDKAYFARDVSRPMIFLVNADLYKKLSQKYSDLRDKKVLHSDGADIQQIQIQDANGSITVSRKKDSPDDWVFDSPDNQKGKPAAGSTILDALGGLQADDVNDRPSPSQLAPLASPSLTAVLTLKDGKAVTVKVSRAVGGFAYAQASDGPQIYKLKVQVLDNLNFKAADLVL